MKEEEHARNALAINFRDDDASVAWSLSLSRQCC